MQGLVCPSVTDLFQHDRSADEHGQVTTTTAKQCKCQSVRTLNTRLDGRGERLRLQTKGGKTEHQQQEWYRKSIQTMTAPKKSSSCQSWCSSYEIYNFSKRNIWESRHEKKSNTFLLTASFDYFIYCVWTRFLEGESEKHPPVKSPESRSPTIPLLIWPILNLMAVGSLLVSFWRPRSGWLC